MIERILALQYWRRRGYVKFASQQEQHVFAKLGRLLLFLLALIMIHTVAMVYFEKLSWSDALWLTVTTVTTVGYGDFSASSWQGRAFTTVCLYIFGISLLAQLAAEFIEYKIESRTKKLKGNWIWRTMNNHLLIINTPEENTDTYLVRLVGQIRATPEFSQLPIQILTCQYPNGLPDELLQQGVVHYHGVAEDNKNLQAVNVSSARYIAILAKNAGNTSSDSLSFDVLNRIQEITTSATIASECAIDTNRSRFKNAGADIVVRPIRAYPELLVRALEAPGTETVMENLFTHEESHMMRFDVIFSAVTWKDIVFSFVENDFGIPMAYINETGVHCNPEPNKLCSGTGIISLTRENKKITNDQVKQCFKA